MKITIAGDFFVTGDHLHTPLFSDEIVSLFNSSDLNILNLECPITSQYSEKIIKTGPNLKTNNLIIEHLKAIKIALVALANNHIMDYGLEGLTDTINELKNNRIDYIGAGLNIKEAKKPYVFEKDGLKVAFLNFAENEWSIATNKRPGANPLNIIDNARQIESARLDNDFVIVIIHGGNEYYSLPSPRIQKQYRFYAERGASAVIGHHPHCISGYELYRKTPIFYSLGNMVFTIKNSNNDWYTGLVLQITLLKDGQIECDINPVRQSKENYFLSLLRETEQANVLLNVEKLSKIIDDEDDLLKNWCYFLDKNKKLINIFSPLNAISNDYMRAGLKRIGFNRILLKPVYLRRILNHLRCEAHYDVILELLKKRVEK